MKMTKKLQIMWTALALSAALIVSAAAAGPIFSDVGTSHWAYASVEQAARDGVTAGTGNGRFSPEKELTYGEFIVMMVNAFYGEELAGHDYVSFQENPEITDEFKAWIAGAWYEEPLSLAWDRGLVSDPQLARKNASRYQMAALMYSVLADKGVTMPVEGAKRMVHSRIADWSSVPSEAQEAVGTVYAFGIVGGVDAAGTFAGDKTVTRAQAAVIYCRMAETIESGGSELPRAAYTAAGKTYAGLVQDAEPVTSHDVGDQNAIDRNVRHMLAANQSSITFRIPEAAYTQASIERLADDYMSMLTQYPEYGYSRAVATGSYRNGAYSCTIECNSTIWPSGEQLAEMKQKTLAEAIRVHDSLWESGKLTADMSGRERAWVIYNWLCDHCDYDDAAYKQNRSGSVGHSAYAAFFNRLALCDGYTGAYNLLLKLAGIECGTASTASHTWSVITADGKTWHCDLTWGDSPDRAVRERYFEMSEAEAFARFR